MRLLTTCHLFIVACLIGLMVSVDCGGYRKEGEVMQIKGSDTEVNLAQRLAEAFMERRPEVSISVTGASIQQLPSLPGIGLP